MGAGGIGNVRDPQNNGVTAPASSTNPPSTSSPAKVNKASVENKTVATGSAALDTPKDSALPSLTEHIATPANQVQNSQLENVIVRAVRAVGRFFSGIGQALKDKYQTRNDIHFEEAKKLVLKSKGQLKNYTEYPNAKKALNGEAKVGSEVKRDFLLETQEIKRAPIEIDSQVKNERLRVKRASFSLMEVPWYLLEEIPKAKIDHRIMAKAAVGKGLPVVEDQFVGCGFLKAARENVDGRGKIVPTSFLKGASDAEQEAQSKGLTNVYTLLVDGKTSAIIRSGVIDTPERAAEFREVLRQCKKDMEAENPALVNRPLRVVSQQLNSFEIKKEAKMIDNQHMYLAAVSSALKGEGIEVMHLNTPSNRWFHETKKQGVLAGIAHTFIRHGEKDSHTQNLDGLGKYAEWLSRDFDLPKSFLQASSNIMFTGRKDKKDLVGGAIYQERINNALLDKAVAANLLSQATRPEDKAKFKKDIKNTELALKQARAGMRKCLLTDYQEMEKAIAHVKSAEYIKSNGVQKSQDAVAALELYKKLLGAQLEIERPPMDRGQEGMILQELNNKLGVIAAMNCKSGLDRTGLWHAVKISMENTEKLDPNPGKPLFTKMVSDWHVLTTEMNKAVASGKSVEQYIAEGSDQEARDLRRLVAEHRNEIAKHLIATGIPITQRSTGVLGLKWNPGIQENRVPLNFLPSSVEVQDTEGNFKRVALVVYNKKTGEPEKLTKEGRELFTKMSALRGS